MKINSDVSGFAPILAVWYIIVGLVVFVGWTFVIGNFLFAMGFTGASFFLVKWAKKKWWPGIMAMLIVVATLVFAYAWFTGAVVI